MSSLARKMRRQADRAKKHEEEQQNRFARENAEIIEDWSFDRREIGEQAKDMLIEIREMVAFSGPRL